MTIQSARVNYVVGDKASDYSCVYYMDGDKNLDETIQFRVCDKVWLEFGPGDQTWRLGLEGPNWNFPEQHFSTFTLFWWHI